VSWARGAGEHSPALEALAASGVKVGLLSDAPALTRRAQLAVTAWGDLAGERQIGMSCGPIPWRAITAWCDRYHVQESETIIELVQAIDTAWLSDENRDTQNRHNPNAAKSDVARGTAPRAH
jgi:hypothetical protein